MEIVQEEGNRNIRRIVDFYSLDAIISVGYRVNSTKATNFRIWATKVLKEFISFASNNKKKPTVFAMLGLTKVDFGKLSIKDETNRTHPVHGEFARFRH